MKENLENHSILTSEQAITDLASRLEKAGYSDALDLVKTELVPMARKKNISLIDAAWEYANPEEEQDTSYFQLFEALQNLKE